MNRFVPQSSGRVAADGRVAFGWIFLLIGMLYPAANLAGQQFSAEITSDRTYVGAPVTLILRITNAKEFFLPQDFQIDGCDIVADRSPESSTQIYIFNGRKTERRTIVMRYEIIPRRPGEFTIPKLTLKLDGEEVSTRPYNFSAEKSETGDLLYVEVVGKKDEVFVGQPLELTLRIGLRPYRDRSKNVKLAPRDMWRQISSATQWGAFAESLETLSRTDEGIRVKTESRDNDQGQSREYYVYEFDATIYPNRPGKIDASDTQVVINYPVALGRSKDPFDSFFGGRHERLSDLFDTNGFRSGFGSRLAISQSRPIVANAVVDSTKVLPIPTVGKPADYRGAVGKYRIITQANSLSVSAGDPITLQIGIVGDGPLDLAQAPPLAKIDALTKDFQVVDQSLAGFVQNDTKVFVTKIRPKTENVSQIPPIPYSFFDPEAKSFKTVYSDPIDIDVQPAETLSLDAIVSSSQPAEADVSGRSGFATGNNTIELGKREVTQRLQSQSPPTPVPWRYYAVVPALLWLAVVIVKSAVTVGGRFRFRSPVRIATQEIRRAKSADEIRAALIDYLAARTGAAANEAQAAGNLRMLGLNEEANQLENLFSDLNVSVLPSINPYDAEHSLDFQSLAVRSKMWLAQTDRRIQATRKLKIRRSLHANVVTQTIVWFIAMACPSILVGGQLDSSAPQAEILAPLLHEADAAYRSGLESQDSDLAKAKTAFGLAANRYQAVVDAGVVNYQLLSDLANAQFLSGRRGVAIANYHRALKLQPTSQSIRRRLQTARQSVLENSETDRSTNRQLSEELALLWSQRLFNQATALSQRLVDRVGQPKVGWCLAAFSIGFWGLLIIHCLKRFYTNRMLLMVAAIPGLVVLLLGMCLWLTEAANANGPVAVLVADSALLYSGDGEEFLVIEQLNRCDGVEGRLLRERSGWIEIALPVRQIGWVQRQQVEIVQ